MNYVHITKKIFTENYSRSLLDFKTRGALMKPSVELEYIVKVAENILSDLQKDEKFLQQKNISHVVFLKVFRYINTRKPNFIESFNFHETSLDVTLSHKFLFIKKIVHFYVHILPCLACRTDLVISPYHGRINSLAGHTVYAYSSGLRAVQFLLRNYATRVDKKGIAPEQGFILLVI